ncbi:MAG TPA: dienelactone hydrolase family protein [Pseudonocardia sp.]|nr:dienelactone hydrolase family protein [Pseudonocardia sp.]
MQTGITFTAADGVALPGVLTVPDGAGGPRPALLMIYEIFGLNDEMRRVARELAAEGYVVLIPDLFARGPVKPLCVARALRTTRRGSGPELDDLESARRWLAARPEVDGDRIGTIGFCLGGGFALLLAETGLYRVSAPFYGRTRDLTRACPMVASFGGRDAETRGYPERLAANLDRLGVPHDIETYPEAGHSFFTRTEGFLGRIGPHLPLRAEYHEPSARDAHRRIVAFFREHLDA